MGKLGFELEIVADYIFSEVKMMVVRCIMHRRFERNRQGRQLLERRIVSRY
ncbi:hypothetical protein [Bradyrhizobium brasilense]|nr:hypothetical protein [Bradyrhizobium brasilense]